MAFVGFLQQLNCKGAGFPYSQSVENPCKLCLGREELNVGKNGGKTKVPRRETGE